MSRSHRISSPCSELLNSAYATAVLGSTPKTYWQLQECGGPTSFDSSGNALNVNNNHITSGVVFLYRQAPGALTEDRDRGILWPGGGALSRSGPISTVTNNFTIEMWINVQNVANNGQVLLYNGSGASNGWGMEMNTNRKITYLAGGVAGGGQSTGVVPLNTWTHVALVRNTTWSVYINGAFDSNIGSTTPNTPSGGNVQIGDGSIQNIWSHVAVYETALSGATISAHFAAA